MAFVAVAAVATAGVNFLGAALNEWRYSTSQGPNTSMLAVGDQVVTIDDVRVGSRTLPPGTPFLVVADDDGDNDSAFPRRGVELRIVGDRSPGSTITVERIRLRVK